LIVGIIESRKGVANLDRILDATNGIGVIWPGPGDLAADLGLIGHINHPDVEESVQLVLDRCTERGIACVGVAADGDEAGRRVQQGFRVIFTQMQPGVAAAIRSSSPPHNQVD
jgi:2-keto-3-deoxy-L-rhamnonate aldolase RhmA